MNTPETRYGILDLVEATGIARRTIRYYIQRELLPPPRGAGRGHYYVKEHLEGLLRIRELQDRGLSLDEIRGLDWQEAAPVPAEDLTMPVIERASHIQVAPGLELVVADGAEPPTPSQIRALALAARNILKNRIKEG